MISRRLEVSWKALKLWTTRSAGQLEKLCKSARPYVLSSVDNRKISLFVKGKVGVGIRAVTKIVNQLPEFQPRGKKVGRSHPWEKHAYVRPTKPLFTQKYIDDRKGFCKRLIDAV